MEQFRERVAVVTGAASGIGRSLALRAASEGMRAVLADIEAGPLEAVAQELAAVGAEVLTVLTDVRDAVQVAALARATMERFGRVDLLMNNAGVAAGGSIWESSVDDWAWVLDINLWGVIHGLRAFVPLMLTQGGEGHIVNTASMAGMVTFHPSAPYHVSKHAVVALTEQLMVSLHLRGAPIRASVLCPGLVRTRILESERNRPGHIPEPAPAELPPELQAMMAQALAGEISAEAAADITFDAIRAGQFYIFTHPELTVPVRERATGILGSLSTQ